ncbi:CAP domain-containing protein [Proteiniclasticum sp. C24MP]|uniref:CAP domain-containing protein n=1 Tax=Proteiniclasticum sp. C24MP TaxID=3374101 RepID=UPI003754019F
MKKLIILFLATSTLFSTSFLFYQNEMKNSTEHKIEDEIILSEHLSEEKSIIIYRPEAKVRTTYPDGFSFNLEDKMRIIHGDLHLEQRKEIRENRQRIAAEEELKELEAKANTKQAPQTPEPKKTAAAVPAKSTATKPAAPAAEPVSTSEPAPAETVAPKPAPEPVKEPAPPKETPAPVVQPVEETKTFNYLSQVEKEILTVTNRYRRENGLSNLTWDDTLYQSSRSHSRLMFETNNFVHTTKYAVAENIYMLASSDKSKYTAEFIVAKWMSSPGHRANILDSRITRMGAGVLTGNQYFAKYDRKLPTIYATQHFK